ncbi:L-seryl-tRNA(Sec) selenium transferase [bacterium]|nr:L-seryl-tRNA(Sec) selenium transferase [bacterium]
MGKSEDPRRQLPGVDSLLAQPQLQGFSASIRQDIIVYVIRGELNKARDAIKQGKSAPSSDKLTASCARKLAALLTPSIKKVVNATGVILHTGLGRAPLSKLAQQAIVNSAEYCNLEFDLERGDRGERQSHLHDLLTVITGAEDALVVNNNAAAVYLTLNTLAHRRESIVSRGQLIEIGGSFRLPDIMKRAGVKLIEVGTTNRTRIQDYADAISPKTALLLRAYPSNYRIDGFTESVTIAQLSELSRQHENLIVVDDLGGGVPQDWTNLGLPYEPNIKESLDSGADLVMVSGDKVLGGPQAGIILGKATLVRKLKKSPLARVLRCDKSTITALETTLREYLHPSLYRKHIPSWSMLTENPKSLRERAQILRDKLAALSSWSTLEVTKSFANAGSGTLPAVQIDSFAVRCIPKDWTSAKWAQALRMASCPIIGTVRDESLWLDMRTVLPDEIETILSSVREVLSKGKS